LWAQAPTYARSNFELPCGELLVEGALFLWRSPSPSALVVTNAQVSPMFNNQRYDVIIDGRKDRRFTVLVARIQIRARSANCDTGRDGLGGGCDEIPAWF
jgi:hypothetical protein